MRASFPPELLAELQQRSPDGSVLLADLGNLWKTIDPTFKPSRYGKESLSALLAEFPHLGRIERVGAVSRWRWISATTQQLAGPDAQVGDPDISSEAKTGLWYLHGEIWRIVTGTDPAKVVDLTTQALVPHNAREVNEQPERFLKLPVADVFFSESCSIDFFNKREQSSP